MDIAILGCGYVGLELGRRLDDSHTVYGFRRSQSGLAAVEEAGLHPIEGDVTDPDSLENVPNVDALVFSASAGRGNEAARRVYNEGLKTVIEEFGTRDSPPDRLVYTSSTGIYGDHNGKWVDETTPIDPATERQEILNEAEQLALQHVDSVGISGTIVRLGGLYGPDRYPIGRYLEGPVTEKFLNLTHRNDAAGAVAFLLENDLARDEIVVAVDEEPVFKPELALWLAEATNSQTPKTQTIEKALETGDRSDSARNRIAADKRCSSEKLRNLGYEFEYPTFREGFTEAVETHLSGG